jgi:hypothetical protein
MGRKVATLLPLWVLLTVGTGRAQSEQPVTDKVGQKARTDKGAAPAAEVSRAADKDKAPPAAEPARAAGDRVKKVVTVDEKGRIVPATEPSKVAPLVDKGTGAPAAEASPGAPVSLASQPGEESGPRAYKDETLPLDKRLSRLRDETNELGTVSVQDRAAPIPTAERLDRQEIGVPKSEAKLDKLETVPELDAQAKERWFETPEWRGRFGELRRCRGEVARRRSVRPASVPAGAVLLRWTIDELGRVREAAVVGTGERVDPDVMSCVHRKMAQWRLDAPPATAFRTDWTVDLRP